MILKVVSASNAANANNNGNANHYTASYANHVAAITSLRYLWLTATQVAISRASKEDKENQTFCPTAVNKQGDAA